MIAPLLALAALASPAFAQTQNATFIAGLIAALEGAGLTTLATVAGSINSTTVGQRVLAQLSTGGPFTIFAPNNNAFTGVPSNITSNVDLVANIIAYHVVPGVFNTTATAPSVTIGRTLLNDSSLVFLEGNKSQVVAWQNQSDGKVRVLNQNTQVTVQTSTVVGNLSVNVIDGVLDLPGSLDAALTAYNLTALRTVLQTAGLLNALNTQHGFTLFAPSDAAFAAAQTQLAAASGNITLVQTVLANHVVNGSTLYSPTILAAVAAGNKLTSAAGEQITGSSNSSGVFVQSGNSTAKVVTTDILLSNGVVHIIDAVLLNTQSNAGAASSAFNSATAAAASPTTESGPIGQTPSPSGSGSGSSGSSAAQPLQVHLGTGLLGLVGAFFFAL